MSIVRTRMLPAELSLENLLNRAGARAAAPRSRGKPDVMASAEEAAGSVSRFNPYKVRQRAGLFAAVALALMSALAILGPAAASPSVEARERPRVVVTIKPIHSIAAAVLGEAAVPELLITGTASPHSYSLTPSDARLLNSADVFVRVSEQVEPFTRRIVSALPTTVEVVTLAETEGLRLLRLRYGGHFDEHAHEEGAHDQEPAASAADGHVWLDPENAKLLAKRLAQVFAARWPQQAEIFAANAERFAKEIDVASEEIAAELEPVRDVPFVVFHDAYQYFEARFGLKASGAVTVNPEVPPGARRIAALRQRIQSVGGMCVFAEPQFSPRVLDAIETGTGAKSGVLDPIGVDLEPGPELYRAMLRKLANDFISCLSREPARAGR